MLVVYFCVSFHCYFFYTLLYKLTVLWAIGFHSLIYYICISVCTTAKKIKFSIKDFLRKCDQIRSFLRIWSQLLKKSLMENVIFCSEHCIMLHIWSLKFPYNCIVYLIINQDICLVVFLSGFAQLYFNHEPEMVIHL